MAGTSSWDLPSWELVCSWDLCTGTTKIEFTSLAMNGGMAMRKVSLIPVALAACGLLAIPAGAQETGKAAKTMASPTPTIDQSLEWKAAFSPTISPDGKRVVYEVQKANWEENAFERNLWIADVASGESHPLTSAKKSSTNAAWSPDAKWVAFLSDRPGQIKDAPERKKQLHVA